MKWAHTLKTRAVKSTAMSTRHLVKIAQAPQPVNEHKGTSCFAEQSSAPSIRYCKYSPGARTIVFTTKPILVFIRSGNYNFQYGDKKYELGPTQLLFIRQGISLECLAGEPGSELILFEWTSDLVTDFVKMTRLNNIGYEMTASVWITDPSDQLQAFISSLQIYFSESEMIVSELAKIKLVELF